MMMHGIADFKFIRISSWQQDVTHGNHCFLFSHESLQARTGEGALNGSIAASF
jgi:hypothetical protein